MTSRLFEEFDAIPVLIEAAVLELPEQTDIEVVPSLALLAQDAQEHLDRGLEWNGASYWNRLFMTFRNDALERGYLLFHTTNHLAFIGMRLFGGIFYMVLWSSGLDDTFQAYEFAKGVLMIVIPIFCILLLLQGSCLRLKSQLSRAHFHELATTVLFIVTLGFDFLTYATHHYQCEANKWDKCNRMNLTEFIGRIAIAVLHAPRQKYFIGIVVVPCAISYSVVPLLSPNSTISQDKKVAASLAPLIGCCISGGIVYAWELVQRWCYKQRLELCFKQVLAQDAFQRAESVMMYLVPSPVLQPLLSGTPVFQTNSATVILADLCNFTNWCQHRTSTEVVEMLSQVITCFDRLALRTSVTRIKTLGDGYIAAAGVPTQTATEQQHAIQGTLFALGMQQELTRCCVNNRRQLWGALQVRVGVHSGQVSAGVLSMQRWAYDVFGEVPRIAAMLEPLCRHGEVLLSQDTLDLLTLEDGGSSFHSTVKDRLEEGPELGITRDGGKLNAADTTAKSSLRTWRVVDAIVEDFLGEAAQPLSTRKVQVADLPIEQHSQARALLFSAGTPRSLLASPFLTPKARTTTTTTSEDNHRCDVVEMKAVDEEIASNTISTTEQQGGSSSNNSSKAGGGVDDDNDHECAPQHNNNRSRKLQSNTLVIDGKDPKTEALEHMVARCSLVGFCYFSLSVLLYGILVKSPGNDTTALALIGVCWALFFVSHFTAKKLTGLRTTILILTCGISVFLGAWLRKTAPLALFGGPAFWAMIPYLSFPHESLAYTSIIVFQVFGNVAAYALGVLPLALTIYWIIFLIFFFSLMRFVFHGRMQRLSEDARAQAREVERTQSEMDKIEVILRLKMPGHVVERIFQQHQHAVGGKQQQQQQQQHHHVLKTSYNLPSCYIAFCRFKFNSSSEEIPSFKDLQYVTSMVDSLIFPSSAIHQSVVEEEDDGSDKVTQGPEPWTPKLLEKVKTIGDTVMLGGSLIPKEAAHTQEENSTAVLIELLRFVQNLTLQIRGKNGIQVLIGAHKGEVTAATIGEANLEYDVFGTTVNTAARLLSLLTDDQSREGSKSTELGLHDGNIELRQVALTVSEPVLSELRYAQKNQHQHQQQGDHHQHHPSSSSLLHTTKVTSQRLFRAKGISDPIKSFMVEVGGEEEEEIS